MAAPKSDRRQPAEWAPHDGMLVGWPSDPSLWADDLDCARGEVADLVAALAAPDAETGAFDQIDLVATAEAGPSAAAALPEDVEDGRVRIVAAPIGDVWLRDTGPIVTLGEGGRRASGFAFNGWGGKYRLGEDAAMAALLAGSLGLAFESFAPFVAEGGAIEVDGEGTAITTRQCLLNPNRNPGADEAAVEEVLRRALGIERVLWLDEGLAGDHTDGHVDNLARFLAPGLVAIQRSTGADDPNRDVYAAIRAALDGATDAGGRRVRVLEVPSPGRVEIDGEPAAASHMNFVIGNGAIVAPHYVEAGGDERAAGEAFDLLMDEAPREAGLMLPSHHLLTGGGSFHCITQQVPTAD